MVKETRLYELLEVEPCADAATLKKKYRELARKYHPDRNPATEDLFKDISLAYATLTDPEKRNVYDIKGETGLKKPCCKAPAYPEKKPSSLKKSSSSFQDRAEPEMTVSNGDENNYVEASGSHERKLNNNKRKLTIGLENPDEPTPQIKKSKEEGHGHSGHGHAGHDHSDHDQAEHDHSRHAHNENNDSNEEEESKDDAEEGCPCCPAIGMNPDLMQQLMWRQMQMEREMYRTRGPGAQVNDHAAQDHSGHVHAGHDHSGHDHARHDHSEHDHAGHNHAGHDHAGHDHSEHDHAGHDHSGHAHDEHNDSDSDEESIDDAEEGEEGCPCCPAIGMSPDMMQQLMRRQMEMEMEMYRARGPATQAHNHAGHDHSGHAHAGHDHSGHAHAGHDHPGHAHAGHDHSGHAHREHNDSDENGESEDDAEEGEGGCPCCPAIGMSPDMMQKLMWMQMEMERRGARVPGAQMYGYYGPPGSS